MNEKSSSLDGTVAVTTRELVSLRQEGTENEFLKQLLAKLLYVSCIYQSLLMFQKDKFTSTCKLRKNITKICSRSDPGHSMSLHFHSVYTSLCFFPTLEDSFQGLCKFASPPPVYSCFSLAALSNCEQMKFQDYKTILMPILCDLETPSPEVS